MAPANPRWNRIPIADLPIQTLLRLVHGRCNARIQVPDLVAHILHIPRLEPGLGDVLCVFVRQDPVEFVTVAERILNEMHVVPDPDVDAFFLDELPAQGVFF